MLTVWEQYIFIETMNVMKYSATDTKKQKKNIKKNAISCLRLMISNLVEMFKTNSTTST